MIRRAEVFSINETRRHEPIWNILDVTPEGRGTDRRFPNLSYR